MRGMVDYLTAACAGTGQATMYNTREEQDAALAVVHGEALKASRRFYALSAVLPMNDRSKQLTMINLLRTGQSLVHLDEDECETEIMIEENVFKYLLETMPFNRVLDLFVMLREAKVNNSRTRRFARMVWEEVDAYRAIKYPTKLRALLRHGHVPEKGVPERRELHAFLFGRIKKASDVKHCALLKDRFRARKTYEALFALPYDIAVDLAVGFHGKTAEDFKREYSSHGKATRKEKLRARQTAKAAVDFNNYSLLELLRHLYQHEDDLDAARDVLDRKASKVAGGIILPEKTALVVDNSYSAIGSGERKFHSLSVIEALTRIFFAADGEGCEVKAFTVGPEVDGGLMRAAGATEIRRPLAEALVWRPNVVLILSDGYENMSAGSAAQVLNTRAVRDSGISVIHLNPVVSFEKREGTGVVRQIADRAPSLVLTAPEQLPMVYLLGRAHSDPRFLEEFFVGVERAVVSGGTDDVKRLTQGLRGLPAPVSG